jgi:predicted AAA+ superfamily ATPase
MGAYLKRLIDAQIERKLQAVGGIVIRGPRAVGKTTTASFHAKSSVRLDESARTLEQAEISPKSILQGETPRLIDEWQLAPPIWNAIRHEIDDRSLPGQFILAGSAAPSDDRTRHTGAGRFARVTLRPMTLYESGHSTAQVDFNALFRNKADISGFGGLTVPDYAERAVRGGWPGLLGRSLHAAREALIDYVDNMSSVDLRTLQSPPSPLRVNALIRAIARNIATEASLNTLAEESEIFDGELTPQTTRKYIDRLSQIYILEELPAWKAHIRSSVRMRVKPKWHFVDPSIAAAALRITPDALIADLNTLGFFFESLAIRDLRVYADMAGADIYHYRDSTNLEIDAIIERYDGKWAAVEIKLGGEKGISEAYSNFAKLKRRLTERKLKDLLSCNIITAGENSYTRPDGTNIIALGHLYVSQA